MLKMISPGTYFDYLRCLDIANTMIYLIFVQKNFVYNNIIFIFVYDLQNGLFY